MTTEKQHAEFLAEHKLQRKTMRRNPWVTDRREILGQFYHEGWRRRRGQRRAGTSVCTTGICLRKAGERRQGQSVERDNDE